MIGQLRASVMEACDEALDTPKNRQVRRLFEEAGVVPAQFLRSLAVERSRSAVRVLQRMMTGLESAGPGDIEHFLLITVAQDNVDGIPLTPVTETTKEDIHQGFLKLVAPIPRLRAKLVTGHSWFSSAAKIVMLERFPGGAYEWEVSGFPRSWFFKVQKSRLLELLGVLIKETHGLYPFFAPHISILREPGSRLTQDELTKSYVQMARGMELQPSIKGMVAASWLYHPKLPEISPHIYDVMHRQIADGGAFHADMGAVHPEKSGALAKSQTRRSLYEAGTWKPRSGVVLWPRGRMIAWAGQFSSSGSPNPTAASTVQ